MISDESFSWSEKKCWNVGRSQKALWPLLCSALHACDTPLATVAVVYSSPQSFSNSYINLHSFLYTESLKLIRAALAVCNDIHLYKGLRAHISNRNCQPTESNTMPSIPTSTTHLAYAAAAALVPATNSSSNATTSAASAAPDDSAVAFYFDIALICVLAAFFLATLPRAIVRFSQTSEWGKGLFLRGGPEASNRFKITSPRQISYPIQSYDDDKSDDSHTLHDHSATAHTMYAYGSKSSASNDGKLASRFLPGHIQSLSTLAYPVSTFFSKTVQPGTSIGQLLLQTIYTCAIVFVTFYKSNPITDPERIGFIAVSQIPVVFVFGAKNSLPGMLLGIGYEKVRVFVTMLRDCIWQFRSLIGCTDLLEWQRSYSHTSMLWAMVCICLSSFLTCSDQSLSI